MSIGLPYKGSKSEIAEELVAKLPPCGKILDACCGGGAVLVALAQSLKYKSVVGNGQVLRVKGCRKSAAFSFLGL